MTVLLNAFTPLLFVFHIMECSLRLSGTLVRYWPDALDSLVHLEELDVSNNKVSFVRAGGMMAFAGSLRVLRLVNSSFSSFPGAIGDLKTLQVRIVFNLIKNIQFLPKKRIFLLF